MKAQTLAGILVGFLVLSTHFSGSGGCGGSSTRGADAGTDSTEATGALSIEATVSTPTTASLSLPMLDVGDSGVVIKTKGIEQTTAEAVEVHAEDTEGNEIGNSCVTDASGACEVTGLTAEQITAGVILVADNGETTIHSYVEHTDEEATEAEAAGTAFSEPCDTETDVSYAYLKADCKDGLKSCGDTVDRRCLKEVTEAVMGDDEGSSDDLGGYCEVFLEAHAGTVKGGSGITPADVLGSAIDSGTVTEITGIVGEKVEGVPVADALKNCKEMLAKMKDAYCTKGSPTEETTWHTLREENRAEFDPKAMAGIFKGFTGSEIGQYEAEDFRGYANAIPGLTGGFAMFGGHEEARRSCVEQFRLGAFRDPAKAGPAMGFMAASFPSCNSPETCRAMSFGNTYDASQAMRAANNGFLEYTGGTSTYSSPSQIYSNMNSTYSNPTYRQSFATGGSAAAKDFIAGFVSKGPDGFKPAEFTGKILAPPGSSCKADTDCLPCDKCNSNVCTALSTKMGASCDANSDCGSDGVLTCTGGPLVGVVSGIRGNCMCASAVPKGLFVAAAAGAAPQAFGMTGGYAAPTAGAAGSMCGTTGASSCGAGTVCNGTVCLPSAFKKGPYAPCSAASECESGACSSGLCGLLTATQVTAANTGTGATGSQVIGARASGQPCAAPSECASYYCSAGVCAAPPTVFQGATTGSSLKSTGATCTAPNECASFNCSGSPLTCQAATTTTSGGTTMTAPTSLPAGSFCNTSGECQSANCSFSTKTCQAALIVN